MNPIRPATAADAQLVEATTEAAYVGYVDAMGQQPAPMLADIAADIGEGRVWLIDGEPAAITMFADDEDWHVASVAVDPSCQGRGFGRALMHHAEVVATERGHRRITLYTHVTMTRPAALYPRLGYVETARQVVDGFDRLYFEKQLGAAD